MLADGFEEIEAVTVIDVLRRGGVSVTVCKVGDWRRLAPGMRPADINPLQTVGSRNINIIADDHLDNLMAFVDEYAALVLPGGAKAAEIFCRASSMPSL